MPTTWSSTAIVYHIYPLGLLGAPRQNDPALPPVSRLPHLAAWTDHIREIGCNTIYLGPVFASTSHGYDTIDYRQVDPRLGTNDDLRDLVQTWHDAGIRVVLDAVFNHVGRDHVHFRDLLQHGEASPYRDWFADVDFSTPNSRGDAFSYTGWDGHLNLVKLNLQNPEVREELFDVVRGWFGEFDIDGLRLDAADVIDKGFLSDLAAVCRAERPDSWLLGEVVHGNYAAWIAPDMLDAVTNYEAFKGLYSSFNDRNLFEIAYSLNREFGDGGVYEGLQLYSFADNHDVDRVASLLKDDADLPLLYTIMFTMPGVPSVYYGSEWGIRGRKQGGDDGPLRPGIRWTVAESDMPHPGLQQVIAGLSALRQNISALQGTAYTQLHVANEQFVYLRGTVDDPAIVVINAASTPVDLHFLTPLPDGVALVDALGSPRTMSTADGYLTLPGIPSRSALVLVPEPAH